MMLIRKKTAQNLCTSIVLSIFANEKRDIWSLENTVNNTYCKINVYISWLMKGLTRESRPLLFMPPWSCRRRSLILSKCAPKPVEGRLQSRQRRSLSLSKGSPQAASMIIPSSMILECLLRLSKDKPKSVYPTPSLRFVLKKCLKKCSPEVAN